MNKRAIAILLFSQRWEQFKAAHGFSVLLASWRVGQAYKRLRLVK